MAVAVVEESVATHEEVEFHNAIEREFYQLIIEQAEIETAHEKSPAVDLGTVKIDDHNEGTIGKFAENVGSKIGEEVTELASCNRSWIINYPSRPDAEDCSFYMKFGSCKFGQSCKFNHPPRRMNQGIKQREYHRDENFERVGQGECKYYLTPDGCKYGRDCNYSHGSQKTEEFNFLGLPIRTGEKECSYYMRTGTCKYGSNCRFDHPEPSAVVGADSPSGYGNGGSLTSKLVSSSSVSSWSSPREFNATSPFTSVTFPPTKVIANSNREWEGYEAATYPTSESGLPAPPAFAVENRPTEINLSTPYHYQQNMVVEEYPERPGEPECNFYLKTGDCKFKSNCKFHHPKSRFSNAKPYSLPVNNKGLPLRPDQPLCTFYHRFGICKYGPACRFDHPLDFASLQTNFRRQVYGN
ncbi:hypothetical protein ABFS83_04G125200 [Erythranthe nasuta]